MSAETQNKDSSRQIAKNVAYGFSTWFLPLALSLIATPIILRTLGDADYGIYALVLGFIGYSFTFSFGRAITKYIAEYRLIGETVKIRKVISATLFISVTVGFVSVLLIYLSAPWIVRELFRIAPNAQAKTVDALYVAALIIVFTILSQVFNSIVQGVHRFDVYARILNIGNFAVLLGNIALALSGFGLLILLIWNLAITAGMLILFAVSAKSLLPEFGFKFSFDRDTTKLVLNYSSFVVGYQVLANLLLLFERGWITRKLGSESLTYYVVPMSLAMFVHSFISSLMLVIFPLASELQSDKEKLLRLYLKATKIACLFVFFLVTTFIIGGRPFLTIYLGNEFPEKSATLLILHSITFGALAILTVSWQMREGLGFPNYNFKLFTICLVLSVSLMFLLTDSYGNLGVAVARLAGFCTIFFSIFHVENWFFQKIQIVFWVKLLGTLTIAAALAGTVQYLLLRSFSTNWFSFIISVLCGAIVYTFALWLFRFVTAEDKILIKSILHK